jgi:hypothetical protein
MNLKKYVKKDKKMILSSELIKEIAKHLRAGNYASDVIDFLNVDHATYYSWKKQSKKLYKQISKGEMKKENLTEYQELLIEFLDAIKKAEKESILRNVATIQKASQSSWQASAWFLERRNYKKWGRHTFEKQEIKQDINLKKIDEELKEIFENGK